MARDAKICILLHREQKRRIRQIAQRTGVSMGDVVRSFLPTLAQFQAMDTERARFGLVGSGAHSR